MLSCAPPLFLLFLFLSPPTDHLLLREFENDHLEAEAERHVSEDAAHVDEGEQVPAGTLPRQVGSRTSRTHEHRQGKYDEHVLQKILPAISGRESEQEERERENGEEQHNEQCAEQARELNQSTHVSESQTGIKMLTSCRRPCP